MKNTANKRKLFQLLCTFSLETNKTMVSKAESVVRHDEADISLESDMLQAVKGGAKAIRIISDDTDVFVLLVYWTWKANVMADIQMQKWDGSVLDIQSTAAALGTKCDGILGMHALSGFDTVSSPLLIM